MINDLSLIGRMKQKTQKLKIINQIYKFCKMAHKVQKNIRAAIYYQIVTKAKNRSPKKGKYSNLLVIAHPDDEMIFFNRFLLQNKDTLVICLTNGGNRVRSNEFFNSMSYYKCKGLIFNFKDGCNVSWNDEKIKKQLSRYINNNQLKMILTHNSIGEYGHSQHIETNRIVTDINKNCEILYTEQDEMLFHDENRLNKTMIEEKIAIFKSIYKTQCLGVLDEKDIYYKYILYEKLSNLDF